MKEILYVIQKLFFASVAEITLIGASHGSELYVQHNSVM